MTRPKLLMNVSTPPPKRLLDQVRDTIRLKRLKDGVNLPTVGRNVGNRGCPVWVGPETAFTRSHLLLGGAG